jgi:hypothetical protein
MVMPLELLQAFDSHAFRRLKPLPACSNVMMMMQLFAAQDALANGMPMCLPAGAYACHSTGVAKDYIFTAYPKR